MNYKVPVIPGDGIGPEIIAEGKKVLEAAGEKYNFDIRIVSQYVIGFSGSILANLDIEV